MVAATGYDLLKFVRHPEDGGPAGVLRLDSHGISILAIGFVVSFFVAWASVIKASEGSTAAGTQENSKPTVGPAATDK